MQDNKIYCDKCKKRVDDIQSDWVTYYIVEPVQGRETGHAIAPLPSDLYMEMYRTRHYCDDCFNV